MSDLLFPEHEWDYVDRAVERVKVAWKAHSNMNPDGKPMVMAFSGGKDSICLFFVGKRASEELGIPMERMFHVQYNVTAVDPPELYRFVRDVMKKQYPFIEIHHPKKTMWQLIVEKHLPPLRNTRYCCQELKEVSSLRGGYTLTGVRRAESAKRAERTEFEIRGVRKADRILFNDNDVDRRWDEFCMQKNAYINNPIIDWSDEDVWHFIQENHLPYCELYDKGWTRLGCLGCPMASDEKRKRDFEAYPRIKEQYIRTFQKMLDAYEGGVYQKNNPSSPPFLDGRDVFDWWMHDPAFKERHREELKEKDLFEEENNE